MRRLTVKARKKRQMIGEAVSGPDTLIKNMEIILEALCKKELSEESVESVRKELDFVSEKLEITPFQSVVLAMLIDSSTPLATGNMAAYLGIRNIRLMSYIGELSDLVNRGMIRLAHEDRKEEKYEIRQEVLAAILRNERYVPPTNAKLTMPKMMERLKDIFDMLAQEEIDEDEVAGEIYDIINKNKRNRLCKAVKSERPENKVLFMFCAYKYVFEGDVLITSLDYNDLFNPMTFRRMESSLESGSNTLIKNGFWSIADRMRWLQEIWWRFPKSSGSICPLRWHWTGKNQTMIQGKDCA